VQSAALWTWRRPASIAEPACRTSHKGNVDPYRKTPEEGYAATCLSRGRHLDLMRPEIFLKATILMNWEALPITHALFLPSDEQLPNALFIVAGKLDPSDDGCILGLGTETRQAK
ncbi:MAG: hypothetical protein ACKPKO_09235, partial [Candidatus Fonsibacter sp.]